ncbi:glucans biosynthesis glucosyltransferase MdoH [Methyloceanibacter caenitepidi]|uniref:Glucans biosynthesis glucosyltransferase H n=1 Tax=Methyloceanibacter caenitepidi TaxID=1384459 RepID=A0A0A8JZ13_9HYPH|nr:glucans biosynthesis glucosyltransferase MdoH [Methyloceanibacter caenitepidi]BAQ15661.1 glucans biosynthesis glucosyltransferase H [Methyloceanibacter caenitepidi]
MIEAATKSLSPTALVPPEQGLTMPRQCLRHWPSPRHLGWLSWKVLLARLFVFATAGAVTMYGATQMYAIVGQSNATSLQVLLVILFALAFAWITLSAATALLGFCILVSRRLRAQSTERATPLTTRTVIVMPVYNEDPDMVFGSLGDLARGLAAKGCAKHFEVFVLSDTSDAETVRREEMAAHRLRSLGRHGILAYYRKRQNNEGKKAGNVAEFVRRWGGRYDFMIVLDADSTMTPGAVIALAQAMEAEPRTGLIQTLPHLTGGETLFARLQQFAAAVYGPLHASGLALWFGNDSNYWGHNAIIRVRAFAEACGLPDLRGVPPFGGPILSHDFVEAALMRRAGYGVSMRPDIAGSFEGTPPTLSEHAARDRRWAQGNLQHARIVGGAGLHWMSRFHLVNGIMSYLASPIWLLFLATGFALSWIAVAVPIDYFPRDFALYPTWPQFDARQAWSLLGVSLAVLLMPKVLAWAAAMIDGGRRTAAGGGLALTGSVVLEVLLSSLLAPVLMLLQSRAVLEVVLGRDSGWAAQQRFAADASFTALVRGNLGLTAMGLALSFAAFSVSVSVWLWLLPVWLGLTAAIPLAYVTARRGVGAAALRAGLFRIAAERRRDKEASMPKGEAVPG